MQAVADELLDRLEGQPQAELVEAYCSQLPVTVITEILGVRAQDRDVVLGFGRDGAPSLDVGLTWKEFRVVDDAVRGFQAWLDDHLARLRREPGPDLLSQLVQLEDEGQRLDETELRAVAGLVLAAGFEEAVQLHGGIGMTAEYAVGHHLSRLTVLESQLGNGDLYLRRLASRVGSHADLDPLD